MTGAKRLSEIDDSLLDLFGGSDRPGFGIKERFAAKVANQLPALFRKVQRLLIEAMTRDCLFNAFESGYDRADQDKERSDFKRVR